MSMYIPLSGRRCVFFFAVLSVIALILVVQEINSPSIISAKMTHWMNEAIMERPLLGDSTADSIKPTRSSVTEWSEVAKSMQHVASERSTRFSHRETSLVLILAHKRSGSTFTGQIFNQNEEALYLFEPLHHIYNTATPGELILQYLNESTRSPPTEKTRVSIAKDVLESFYNCNLINIDIGSLKDSFMRLGVKSSNFTKCGGTSRESCVRDFIETCRDSRLRVIKTIRLRMSDICDLFDRLPSLKVIQLFRDPRGILSSRIALGRNELEWASTDGVVVCDSMRSDLNHSRLLEEQYPGRVTRVLYESLAEEPLVGTQELYRFLGEVVPGHVTEWVRNNTQSLRNSSEIAWKWRRTLSWDVVQSMDEHCSDVYEHLGYLSFKTENELREMAIPARG